MKTAELTGADLALWVARNDPRCNDITFRREGDHGIGYGEIGTSEEFPCVIVTSEAHAVKRIMLRKKYGHIEIYAPHEDWVYGGPLIQQHVIGFGIPVTDAGVRVPNGDYQAFLKKGSEMVVAYGPTHLIAAMRSIVRSVYGDTVPDEVA
jgi:hypothetical protein